MTSKKIIGGIIIEIGYTLIFLFVLYSFNMILVR